jgi:hypothetical protein
MKIFTYAFNHPTYLQYQIKCLNKFVQEPFEHYCIDNASEQKYTEQFLSICNDNKIQYRKNLKPDHSLAGVSHYSALQWSWKTIISQTEEIVLMLDHDTFPIDYVSITELLGDACLAGPPQSRGEHITYFHPSCMIFNTATLPKKDTISFKGSIIDGLPTDIGGELHYYFTRNPDVKKKCLKHGHIHTDNPFLPKHLIEKYGYEHVFEMVEGKLLHTRNGSNWAYFDKQLFDSRDKFIFEILDDKLKV